MPDSSAFLPEIEQLLRLSEGGFFGAQRLGAWQYDAGQGGFLLSQNAAVCLGLTCQSRQLFIAESKVWAQLTPEAQKALQSLLNQQHPEAPQAPLLLGIAGGGPSLQVHWTLIAQEKGLCGGLCRPAEGAGSSLELSEALPQMFESAFRFAPIGMALIGPQGQWLKINEQVTAMFGYDEAALQHIHISDMVVRQKGENAQPLHQQIFDAPGGKFQGRFRFFSKTGQNVWVNIHALAHHTPEGQPRFIVAQLEDQTQQVETGQALERSRQLFSQAFEQASVGMLLQDTEGHILDANPAFAQMIGYSRQQLSRTDIFAITHPEDRELTRDLLDQIRQGQTDLQGVEKRYQTQNGPTLWVRVSASNLQGGRYWMAHVEDITADRMARQALRESEMRFRAAFDQAPLGMALIRRSDFSLMRANQTLCRILQCQAQTLQFNWPEKIIAADHLPAFRQALEQLREADQPLSSFQTCAQDQEGQRVFLSVYSSKLIDGEYWIFHFEDITEKQRIRQELLDYRDHLEELVGQRTNELRQQKERLEATLAELQSTQAQLVQSEKMASLGVLTAGIAHEINNPINFIASSVDSLQEDIEDLKAVLGAFDNLEAETPLTEQLQAIETLKQEKDYEVLLPELDQLLGSLRQGAQRTAEIVKGLRIFSHLSEDQYQATDLHQNLESALVLLGNELKNGIAVERDYGDIPKVEGDAGQLNQVFINLLTNAVQALKGKGTLWISTWQSREGEVALRIADNGTGMDQATREHIFEPFYTTKAVGEGTGLGLWISYSILQKHGGRIEVSSQKGQGSAFTVYLPTRQERPATEALK